VLQATLLPSTLPSLLQQLQHLRLRSGLRLRRLIRQKTLVRVKSDYNLCFAADCTHHCGGPSSEFI
jgi:hypothetical protein